MILTAFHSFSLFMPKSEPLPSPVAVCSVALFLRAQLGFAVWKRANLYFALSFTKKSDLLEKPNPS